MEERVRMDCCLQLSKPSQLEPSSGRRSELGAKEGTTGGKAGWGRRMDMEEGRSATIN
jgi:hypothetical protein